MSVETRGGASSDKQKDGGGDLTDEAVSYLSEDETTGFWELVFHLYREDLPDDIENKNSYDNTRKDSYSNVAEAIEALERDYFPRVIKEEDSYRLRK